MNESRGVIWDHDGVLVDSGPFHFDAWKALATSLGRHFTEGDFRRTFGMRNDDIIRYIASHDLPAQEIWSLSEKKEEAFRTRVRREGIKAFPGVVRLVKELHRVGFKQAIGSSTPLKNIELVLSVLDMAGYFQAIVSEQDVTEGKPNPQVFLIAAKRLGLPPRCLLVIEDAVAGVKASKAGGMGCIAVTNTNAREKLGEADLVVDSLEEVTPETIDGLIPCQEKGNDE